MAKKCKVCGEKFIPTFTSFQKTCNAPECLVAFGKTERTRINRKETKEAKRDRSYWMRRCQTEFNKYIRNRDKKDPCISCNRHHDGQYHAGHYKTVGGHPALRFCEDNCHKQCSVCNNYKSGNLSEYRANLLIKIGLERVEWLEGPHDPVKYTIEDLQEMLSKYQALNKKWVQSPR
jgi:hypothetical protein